MTVLIAEGMADVGIRTLRAAGATIVTPTHVYDPITVTAIVVRSVFRFGAAALARFPNLRVIAKLGTGLDNIDEDACRARGVVIVSAPGMNSVSTAEFTIMQVLAIWKNAYEIHDRVHTRDFRRSDYHGRELAGTTAAVIGYGSIGKQVVERLRPFVREVLVYDRAQASRCATTVGNVRFVTDRDALLPHADILILAVTLAGNERMMDADFLAAVKPSVLLVNMARGGLVDEAVLMDFLRTHPEAHYATDVIAHEPDYTLPPAQQTYTHPLLALPNVTFTPHIACLTSECQERIAIMVAEDLIRVLCSESLDDARPAQPGTPIAATRALKLPSSMRE